MKWQLSSGINLVITYRIRVFTVGWEMTSSRHFNYDLSAVDPPELGAVDKNCDVHRKITAKDRLNLKQNSLKTV